MCAAQLATPGDHPGWTPNTFYKTNDPLGVLEAEFKRRPPRSKRGIHPPHSQPR